MKRSIPLSILIAALAATAPRVAKGQAAGGHPDHSQGHDRSHSHRQNHGHSQRHGQGHGPGADTAFARLQARGHAAMGVDQYTSTHRFDVLPDGGRIELQRDVDDPAGTATIRRHLRAVAEAFAAGNLRTPAEVHQQEVPGTAVMARRRDAIRYTFRELPRGGEVRILTTDPEALRAIHDFLAFQRSDHRAGGRTH